MDVADDNVTLPEYRAVSPWAIAALLVGLAAPLALASPLLMALPLLGVLLGCTALRVIHAHRDQESGAALARVGLFLSLFILVFVPARHMFRMGELETYAVQLSDKALELLRKNDVHEVHHLTTRQFLTRDPAKSLADVYGEDSRLADSLKRFSELDAVKLIVGLGGDFEFAHDSIESLPAESSGDAFLVRYHIRPGTAKGTSPFTLWVSVERRVDLISGDVTWWLRQFSLEDPSRNR